MVRTGLTLGLILTVGLVSSAASAAYPTCKSPLLFSIKQNKCVPRPPVVCRYGVVNRTCRPPPPGVNPCSTGPDRAFGQWNEKSQQCLLSTPDGGFAF